MSSYYSVRPATVKDARTIAELHAHTLQAALEGLLSPEELARIQPDAARVAHWRDAVTYGEPQVLLAVDGDRPVGFVGFDRSRDPKTKPTTGEIWALYVQPGDWDQGAGLALWDAAREGLLDEECTEVTVWVPLRNERALRFFELAGFKRELKTARTTAVGTTRLEEIRLRRALD
jgi:ribosomal protein S18 acetylase RimI-like enzyme